MFYQKHNFFHLNNPWLKNNNEWHVKEYRIVGTVPFIIEKEEKKENCNLLNLIENNFNFWLVKFSSGRLNIGYDNFEINKFENNENKKYKEGDFVILEADRGNDCGQIISKVNKKEYKNILEKIDKNLTNKELHPKKIFKKANFDDLNSMKNKPIKENQALKICQEKSTLMNLNMKIEKCEYQFDMNKLTFFFTSEYQVDFRELVKELYKEFKTRIWLCATEKSRNHYLKALDENLS